MDNNLNGFSFLERLREQTGKQNHSFGEFGEYLNNAARKKGIPIGGKFELTPLCNFSCDMCYVHLNADQLQGRSVLSVDTWKDLMHQAWEAGMIAAGLTGGECLVYPGFDELYLYLHSLGCEVSVLTNGFLLNEGRIQFFKEHMPSMIQITLYGWNDDVYERVTGQRAFTVVANNIRHATEAGLPLHITLTPCKHLGEDLIETVRVANELCNSVTINNYFTIPRDETGRSEHQDDAETDLYIRAIQYLRKLRGQKIVQINEEDLPPCGGPSHETSECGLLCGGGRSGFSIDWEGTMMPCANFQLIRAHPLKEGFAAAWAKINQEANRWPRIPECDGCAYEEICNHCASNTLRFAAPGKVPVALCEQTRAMVRNGALLLPECN